MNPSMNDIVQIIPAPADLCVSYHGYLSNPVVCLALVAVDDGFGTMTRDVVPLVVTDLGIDFALDDTAFNRLEWSVRKPCKCSTPTP